MQAEDVEGLQVALEDLTPEERAAFEAELASGALARLVLPLGALVALCRGPGPLPEQRGDQADPGRRGKTLRWRPHALLTLPHSADTLLTWNRSTLLSNG